MCKTNYTETPKSHGFGLGVIFIEWGDEGCMSYL